jgi:hypothetical protein
VVNGRTCKCVCVRHDNLSVLHWVITKRRDCLIVGGGLFAVKTQFLPHILVTWLGVSWSTVDFIADFPYTHPCCQYMVGG